jgi:protein-tyrosine phosphatase
MSRLHWIATRTAGRLAIMARPRADDWLEAEVDAWKSAGLDQVVSLLELEEIVELGLRTEPEICREKGIAFLPFPIPDRGVPDAREARHVASTLARDIANGRSVAIHCRAGIGRASLMAACVLVCSGVEACEALELIRDARGLSVPDTEEQRDWLLAFGRA